jgi:hypothetical protein
MADESKKGIDVDTIDPDVPFDIEAEMQALKAAAGNVPLPSFTHETTGREAEMLSQFDEQDRVYDGLRTQLNESMAKLEPFTTPGAMDMSDLAIDKELEKLKGADSTFNDEHLRNVIKMAREEIKKISESGVYVKPDETDAGAESSLRSMEEYLDHEKVFQEMTDRLKGLNANLHSDLEKMRKENHKMFHQMDINPDEMPASYKDRLNVDQERSKFVKSVEEYKKMLSNLKDVDFSERQVADEYMGKAQDLAKSSFIHLNDTKAAMDKVITHAQEQLKDNGLYPGEEAWRDPESYAKRFTQVSEEEADKIMESFHPESDFNTFAQKVKEMTQDIPLGTEDLAKKVKEWEEKFRNDPQKKEMEQKLRDMDEKMKKLDEHIKLEEQNALDMGVQLQADSALVEEKFKEELKAHQDVFTKQMEEEYERMKEKLEAAAKKREEEFEKEMSGITPLDPLYEEKVDKLEERVKRLEIECAFLRARLEEKIGDAPLHQQQEPPPAWASKFENLVARIDKLESGKAKENLDAMNMKLIEKTIDSRSDLKRLAYIRVNTPFGTGLLLDRRADDGVHEIELLDWKLSGGSIARVYMNTVTIALG